jgi:hypothetical protein
MKNKRKISIITQISILAIAGLILVGAATFFSQLNVSKKATTDNIKSRAAYIAAETAATVMEYPAHDWLIRYWYEHADELDMERYYSLCITLYCVAESLFDSHVLLARSDKKRAHFGWNQKDSSACASVEESINNMLEDAGEDAEVAVLRPMFTNEGIVGHAVDPYIAFEGE